MSKDPKHSHHDHDCDHDHSHDHGHGNDHDHDHGFFSSHQHHVSSFGKAFAIGIALNLIFVGIEAGYGFFANSLALLSDAGHNLGDVLGLFLAWFATWLARRRPSAQFTYGLRSSSILAAVVNAVILLVAVAGIIWEAILRFSAPASVDSTLVMIVAGIGIVINGVTAALFVSGSKSDLNIRGAFLHMLSDALVSLGVVVAGFLMLRTGLTWIDPVVSIVIGVVIIMGTWGLLRDSVAMALAGVPAGIDKTEVEAFLSDLEGVARVHDLHIWALSTSQTALTAHLIRSSSELPDRFLFEIGQQLNTRFKIGHVTLQVERGDDPRYACPLALGDCT